MPREGHVYAWQFEAEARASRGGTDPGGAGEVDRALEAHHQGTRAATIEHRPDCADLPGGDNLGCPARVADAVATPAARLPPLPERDVERLESFVSSAL